MEHEEIDLLLPLYRYRQAFHIGQKADVFAHISRYALFDSIKTRKLPERKQFMLDQSQIAQELSHVMWIAGSPCSGKSTISHTITRIYVFLDYHVDALARNHMARRIATGDAEATAFMKMNMDQRWIERSVETLVQETIESWTRDFRLVIEDLLAMPKECLIVAEGNFFPVCIAPYLSRPHQAIWLTATDAFCERARRQKRAALIERQKRHGVYNEGSDAEKHLRNIIDRDCQLARYVKQQAEELHLPHYEVDGSRSLEEMTELVERHFDPYLIQHFGQHKSA
jgi:adenylate kinase family enzyme